MNCPFLRYSTGYILSHSINLKRCDAMIGNSTFQKIFENLFRTVQLIDIAMGKILWKDFT